MTKLPHIVKAWMQARKPVGRHPDADLLAGFAEQTLLPTEREGVLAHLSTCAECREVVALAQPEAAELAAPQPTGVKRSWWALPSFQYGAVAAALAAVAVGLMLLREPERPAAVAKLEGNQPASVAEPPQQAKNDAGGAVPGVDASAPAGTKTDAKATTPSARKEAWQAINGSVSGAAGAGSGAAVSSAIGYMADKQSSDAYAQSRRQEKDAAAGTVSVEAISTHATTAEVAAMEAKVKDETAAAKAGEREKPQQAANANAQPEARSDAPAASASNEVLVAGAAPARQGKGRTAQLPPPPAASPMDSLALRSVMSKSAAQPWRVENGRLGRYDASRGVYDDVSVPGAAKLSVVGFLANEVWVGGEDGTLFYSNDQGAHWIPVSTGGWSKDAKFAGLTPTARQSVEVYLSNGERWRSANGGASWTRYR